MIKFIVLKDLPKEFGGSGEQGWAVTFAVDAEAAIADIRDRDLKVLTAGVGELTANRVVQNTTYSIQ